MSSKKSSNASLTGKEEQDVEQSGVSESTDDPRSQSQPGSAPGSRNSNHEVREEDSLEKVVEVSQSDQSLKINSCRIESNLSIGQVSSRESNETVTVEASRSRNRIRMEGAAAEENANANGPMAGTSRINNNCMSLLPISSKTNQMIPIALLRKTSTGSAEGNSLAGGLMGIINGTNKVAPAVTNPESVTTVGAAVLMLVPKKSDAVCVDMEQENNCGEALQQGANVCSSDHGVVKPTPSYDSYEEVCRICHDNPSKLELMSPCLCKGSMSKVHRTCLERWLGESAKNSCEICGYEYNTVRKPKYTGCSSVFQWIRHPLSPSDTRNLFFDIACFFILTPLAAISSWLCVVGAQHYTFGEERRRKSKFHDTAWGRNDRADSSNATWTSVGLLSLTGTLLVAYSVWLFVAIKYHIQAWSDWQQRNFTVTIVPFEDGCMGRPPAPRERSQSNSNNNNSGSLGPGGGGSGVSENSNNNNVYNFESNPNFMPYAGHHGHHHHTGPRGRGRNFLRHGRNHHRAFQMPAVFNQTQFLRSPPPGYTISETTMLYQALYGSDSESFFNENILAFLAESSENVTEEPSGVTPIDWQIGVLSGNRDEEQQQRLNDEENLARLAADSSSCQFRDNEMDPNEDINGAAPITTHSDVRAASSQNNNFTNRNQDIHSTRSLNSSIKAGNVSSTSPNADDKESCTRDRNQVIVIPISEERDDVTNKNLKDPEIV